jgi:transcriptional regulator with XRE-family HTH domain
MTRGKNKPADGDGNLRQIIGQNVKAAREHAGFSQRELSERANIAQSYLSQLESGKWNIGADNIERIAKAMGFFPYDLLHPDFDPATFHRFKVRS